ncbi:ATP synthase subunit g, mitochondrial-like [Mercenaria mercenaria]|uniref:ATP synthase subunit g, mitochondrial-like n=1 Tax=Mercenaria mercenaria TaxID=6596 RepID=UPI00234F0135|nr:ATP synthase subunit g, mitochondrial-like [Mercenaria mercenaria]
MAAFFGRQATKLTNAYTRTVNYSSKKWPIIKKYAAVELMPPTPADIPRAISEAASLVSKAQNGAWKNLTISQATVNTFVAIEVAMWFFAGECIGKRSWVGYPVPADGSVFTYVSFTYD